MLRLLFPLFLILIAGGVFFIWTDPLITGPKTIDEATGDVAGGILALRDEKIILDKAIDDARLLKERISELDTKLSQISADQIKRLDTFLPESIDGVQLVVDVNNIAKRSGLAIDDVDLRENQSRSHNLEVDTSTLSDPKAVPVTLSFVTNGSYGQIRSFISDLAKSLRIMDLSTLSFTVNDEKPTTKYNFSLTTYWIK